MNEDSDQGEAPQTVEDWREVIAEELEVRECDTPEEDRVARELWQLDQLGNQFCLTYQGDPIEFMEASTENGEVVFTVGAAGGPQITSPASEWVSIVDHFLDVLQDEHQDYTDSEDEG